MVRVRNPLTQEIMSVRGATTFWVTDGNGQKHKYLIEDYKVSKGVVPKETKPGETPAVTPAVVPAVAPAVEPKAPAAPAVTPVVKAPGVQQVVVKQPEAPAPEGVPSGKTQKPAEKPAEGNKDWWY